MAHTEAPLPSYQHHYEGLPVLTERALHRRREGVFLILAGLFLGTLAMLNILGITRFIRLGAITDEAGDPVTVAGVPLVFAVAVGVLPYPVTFLCTDFISELFGRARANAVVLVGLGLNAWVVFVLWLGGALPGFETLDPQTGSPAVDAAGRLPVFYELQRLAFGAVLASMAAYLTAQLIDVQLFHFWKSLTNGRHLWLRNNGSTLVSQLVDTVAVILITHYLARSLPVQEGLPLAPQLLMFVVTGYGFKLAAALLDTIPFIVGTRILVRYLRLAPPDQTDH